MTVSDQGMNCRRRQSHAGFTLLELLISITLLGFILVLLFGGLRLGIRSWDTVQQRVDNLNTVRAVESFLRREMEMTYPYRWKGTPEQRMAFLGERNKVSFVAQLPSRIGTGGLYLASLELERSSKGRRLVWRYMPVTGQLHDFSVLDQAQEMVLAGTELGTVDDIWLSYLGPEGEKGQLRWADRWESTTRLPSLIRIQVKFSNGVEWPDFVVAPKLSSEFVR
ncbi:prepilin-type N-terminal cleavage/methylation domain-containing protein [Candidatus Aalborgicola defluviihabitans]|uniref:prepilin-type N-terminal cleavage/methylation domain-containing protein n=2 Tax=Candidatus Aalborgicola defluviihabitans TaxID=3386187 RepID=UPI00390A7119|nr:prepilin-type N-terminal cleavage/methylation domain-containing protein [Burkholderiales bacterium]